MKQKRLKILSIIAVFVILLFLLLQFLVSIRFNLYEYLFNSPDPIKGFTARKGELELIIEEINSFVNSKDDFFQVFDGSFTVSSDGLIVYYQPQYSRNITVHPVSDDMWEQAKGFTNIFPTDFYYSHIRIDADYPDYVFFCSDERTARVLVYTGGERPTELINSYWEDFGFVHVKWLAHGWYDIAPTH